MATVDMPVQNGTVSSVELPSPAENEKSNDAPAAPRHTFKGTQDGKSIPDALADALLADDPSARVVALDYESSRKNGRTVKTILAVGQTDGWTPALSSEATHKIARGKETEYTRILRDACAIRGGTVVAVSIGYKPDALGFRIYNPAPVRAGLDKAFFQMTDEDRRRIDTDYLILPNDQQADDYDEVSGYFLVKIRGYRVK